MATGYTRQSSANISAGQPVSSAPVNNEFNQLVSAFSGTTGHDHSGGTGLGPNLGTSSFNGLTAASVGIAAANGSNAFTPVTLTGTTNQITVTNGTGAAGNPTIAISNTYPGQTSIITLGTITTGAWNGTAISTTYGGLGGNFSSATGAVTMAAGVTSIGILAGTAGGTGVNNGSSSITLGGNLITANTFTTSGAFPLTLTTTGSTNVTLPTSGTLITSGVTSLASLTSAPALVSVGTITSGGWNGTVISPTYGGTGINNGSNTLTLAGNHILSGAFSSTFTFTGITSVTFPTTGTLVNSAVTTLSSLSSIGTVTTGTWNGSIITGQFGGTGVNNGGNTITLAGNLTTSGANPLTLTTTGTTNVTLPTSGTLAVVNSQAFTGTPTAPTAAALTNNSQISTTAYVDSAVAVLNPNVIKSIHVQTFTASGTYTPTTGMVYCDVTLVGGGAGGSNSGSTTAPIGGGGAGGTCRSILSAATIGSSQTVTIGSGGGSGVAGGQSKFGSILTANGGAISSTVAGGATLATANGGVGGTATGGQYNIPGGNGGFGITMATGSSPNGSKAGDGGNSYLGVGGQGLLGFYGSGTGGAATGYGAGGGSIVASAGTGGSGTGGVCIIVEYCNV